MTAKLNPILGSAASLAIIGGSACLNFKTQKTIRTRKCHEAFSEFERTLLRLEYRLKPVHNFEDPFSRKKVDVGSFQHSDQIELVELVTKCDKCIKEKFISPKEASSRYSYVPKRIENALN